MNVQEDINGYPKYSLEGVKKLNKDWGKNRIINVNLIYKDIYYIVCDTGYCDTDGRYCIALPANTDIKNHIIRKKYNLF